MATQIPEPAEPAIVMAGGPDAEWAFMRVDARGYPDDPYRWWPLAGVEAEPVTWGHVCHTELVGPEGTTYEPRLVQRLYRQAEVDELVARAVADGGYEQIGDHRIALSSGRCLTHGEVYEVPHELDRLRQRHAGEVAHG